MKKAFRFLGVVIALVVGWGPAARLLIDAWSYLIVGHVLLREVSGVHAVVTVLMTIAWSIVIGVPCFAIASAWAEEQ